MSWRNRKIFGSQFSHSRFHPTKIHLVVLLAVGIIALGSWLFFDQEESIDAAKRIPKTELTGAAVAQQPQTTTQEQEAQQQAAETAEEQPAAASPEEERQFYEYKEECARDMKQRQDDISDLTTQVDEYTAAVEALEQEYAQKLQELQEQYQIPLDNNKAKKDKAQRELEAIKQKWSERKTYCDQKYPA